jgi:cytochrome c6
MTKYFFILASFLLLFSCGDNQNTTKFGQPADGKTVFQQYCVLCHGANGKLGVNGAKDLTVSPLTLEERIQVITDGRKIMASYKNILTADEIKVVAEYTMGMK